MEIYNKENVIEMGYIYNGLLHVLNKKGNNPYPNAEMWPYKSIVMVLPRAMSLGIPKELNDRIAKCLDAFSPDDVDHLMHDPVPMEFRSWWFYGFDKYKR